MDIIDIMEVPSGWIPRRHQGQWRSLVCVTASNTSNTSLELQRPGAPVARTDFRRLPGVVGRGLFTPAATRHALHDAEETFRTQRPRRPRRSRRSSLIRDFDLLHLLGSEPVQALMYRPRSLLLLEKATRHWYLSFVTCRAYVACKAGSHGVSAQMSCFFQHLCQTRLLVGCLWFLRSLQGLAAHQTKGTECIIKFLPTQGASCEQDLMLKIRPYKSPGGQTAGI